MSRFEHIDPEKRDYQASLEMLLEDITMQVQRRRKIVNGGPNVAGLSHVEAATKIADLSESLKFMALAASIVGKP